MSEPKHTNRLANEKSPYLLQHAHNPVDWYPWGDEAFSKARTENKPILLSIGYATCHWCHVMERESFENEDTAAILNAKFVAIKLDREERPDVDQIYMKALHATGQHGGWPLNMFLTPELLPITGGTYFPPQPAFGRPSFRQVLESIDNMWQNNRAKIDESATALHNFLKQESASGGGEIPGAEALEATFRQYSQLFDEYSGGFTSNGPNKFPPSMGLLFLLTYYRRSGEAHALRMVEETLDHMRRGGIYDQIGGGLSRYATDHDWLVPHFEKMLYDNALFLWALTDSYRLTGNERYRDWGRDVCEYLRRDMTSPEGAFYSAEDADSEGEEGKFYVWSLSDFDQTLSSAGFSGDERKLLAEFWGLSMRGNWEGKNILHEGLPRERFVAGLPAGTDAAAWQKTVDRARTALLAERNKRIRPLRDDKILTSWNALMISALSQAARAFDDTELYARAEKAADFLWQTMRQADGSLLRRYREGEARIPATLPDYALLGNACLDLYRAGFAPRFFERAQELAAQIITRFDGAGGAYYETSENSDDLIVRSIESYDGVEPSGNSAAARLFHTLALYGVEPAAYHERARKIFAAFPTSLSEQGAAHSFLLKTFAYFLEPPAEIALVTPGTLDDLREVLNALATEQSGESVQAVAHGDNRDEAGKIVPLLADRAVAEKDTFYVCRQLACERPVHSLDNLRALLNS